MENSIINIKNNKLLVIIAISILILLISSIARHELFNSGGDLAFFDQCVYLISQGKNPISSSTVTTGLVITILLISSSFNCFIAF